MENLQQYSLTSIFIAWLILGKYRVVLPIFWHLAQFSHQIGELLLLKTFLKYTEILFISSVALSEESQGLLCRLGEPPKQSNNWLISCLGNQNSCHQNTYSFRVTVNRKRFQQSFESLLNDRWLLALVRCPLIQEVKVLLTEKKAMCRPGSLLSHSEVLKVKESFSTFNKTWC